jgi:hypothetical protein
VGLVVGLWALALAYFVGQHRIFGLILAQLTPKHKTEAAADQDALISGRTVKLMARAWSYKKK